VARIQVGSEIPEQVAFLEPLLGTALTAYVAGAGGPGDVTRWACGAAPDDAARRRLGTAYRIARLFQVANATSRLRAWLREVDPDSWQPCPAERIRRADDPFDLTDIEADAGAYLGIKPLVGAVPRRRVGARAH
jgi:hypothetical protein